LKVREDLHSQIAHDILSEQCGQNRLAVRADEVRNERQPEQNRDA
jgi:hypothetical protein